MMKMAIQSVDDKGYAWLRKTCVVTPFEAKLFFECRACPGTKVAPRNLTSLECF